MKSPDAIGKVFAARHRPRQSSSGSGLFSKAKARWRAIAESIGKHPKLFYWILLAVPIFWVLFDFVSFSFGTLPATQDSIQLTGLKHVSPVTVRSEIFRKLRLINAENLIEVDLTGLSEHLVKHIPAIRSVTITKNIGRGVMSVAVVERTGIALIRNSAAMLEVDRDGMLYRTDDEFGFSMPVVDGLAGSVLASGRNLYEHPSGAGVLRVVTAFPPNLVKQLKSVRVVRPDYFELQMANGMLVKADPATFPNKVGRFQKIVQKFHRPTPEPAVPGRKPAADRPEGREVAYIDIRFQQDVIAYRADPPKERGLKKGR